MVFRKSDLEIYSVFGTDSNAVPYIVPLADYILDLVGNHYTLSGGVEANQSVLTYNRAYRDDITWSALTIVSPPLPPVLAAASDNSINLVNLSWTTNATGFTLEETTSLVAPNWTAVTNVPVVVAENFLVTLPKTAEGEHFFRLDWLGQ